MRTLAALLAAVVLMNPVATAQDRASWFSRPTVPPREALDRLGLNVAWRTKVPVGAAPVGVRPAGRPLGRAGRRRRATLPVRRCQPADRLLPAGRAERRGGCDRRRGRQEGRRRACRAGI